MNAIEMIKKLGGVSALARKLGFDRRRVSVWQKRGIPARILLDNQKMFSGYK